MVNNLEKIELQIKLKGYTKVEFASVLGITRDGLYKKLRGQRPFTKLELEKISELLEIEIN